MQMSPHIGRANKTNPHFLHETNGPALPSLPV